jgi:hypothetical protein
LSTYDRLKGPSTSCLVVAAILANVPVSAVVGMAAEGLMEAK